MVRSSYPVVYYIEVTYLIIKINIALFSCTMDKKSLPNAKTNYNFFSYRHTKC